MTKRKKYDDLFDLLPSELLEEEAWPPSDEEIEEREQHANWLDLERSVPDTAERNRNLK
tara:strand:+ start:934 stop:1110 length:177 start_codon:yes stop_codon:yes gene_type:complete